MSSTNLRQKTYSKAAHLCHVSLTKATTRFENFLSKNYVQTAPEPVHSFTASNGYICLGIQAKNVISTSTSRKFLNEVMYYWLNYGHVISTQGWYNTEN